MFYLYFINIDCPLVNITEKIQANPKSFEWDNQLTTTAIGLTETTPPKITSPTQKALHAQPSPRLQHFSIIYFFYFFIT
jgi:hypothetical protein